MARVRSSSAIRFFPLADSEAWLLRSQSSVALHYYGWLRRHQGLGATPAEILLDRRPAHLDAVPPQRGRPGQDVDLTPSFEIRYLDPDQRLPYLVRQAA